MMLNDENIFGQRSIPTPPTAAPILYVAAELVARIQLWPVR